MIHILGVPIHTLSRKEVFVLCHTWLRGEGQHHIITANPEIIVKSRSNASFRNILSSADLVVADGVGIQWAASYLQKPSFSRIFSAWKKKNMTPIRERITGSDVVQILALEARDAGLSVFCLGGFRGTAMRAAKHLREKYIGLKAVGYTKDHRASIHPSRDLSEILFQTKPAVVFVGYGAPVQEQWIFHNLSRYPFIKVAVGVGGTLDYLAGNRRRAPVFYQRHGIEWLWRVIQQPMRIPRIIRATVYFPFLILASASGEGYDTNDDTKKYPL